MTSTPTTRLRLDKQAIGDNPNAWGSNVNAVFDLVDEAVSGFAEIAVNGNVVLSVNNFASDQARRAILRFTGAGGFSVTIPAVEKMYYIDNRCSGDVILKTAATAGSAVVAGTKRIAYCDGATVTTDTSATAPSASTVAFNPTGSVGSTNVQAAIAEVDADVQGLRFGTNNAFINSQYRIWQKGISFGNPASGAALADMTRIAYDGAGGSLVVAREPFQDDQPGGVRFTQSAAETGGTFRSFVHFVESARTFAGKRVAVSFEASHSVGYTDKTIAVFPKQNFGTGGSPSARVDATLVAASSLLVTLTPQRMYAVFDFPSVSAKTFGSNGDDTVTIEIALPRNSTWDLALRDFQVEAIPTTGPMLPRPFERPDLTLQTLQCQRFVYKSYELDVAPGTGAALGVMTNTADTTTTTLHVATVRYPVPMAKSPVVTLFNPVTSSTTNPIKNYSPFTDLPATLVNSSRVGVNIDVAATSVAAGNSCGVQILADASYS